VGKLWGSSGVALRELDEGGVCERCGRQEL